MTQNPPPPSPATLVHTREPLEVRLVRELCSPHWQIMPFAAITEQPYGIGHPLSAAAACRVRTVPFSGDVDKIAAMAQSMFRAAGIDGLRIRADRDMQTITYILPQKIWDTPKTKTAMTKLKIMTTNGWRLGQEFSGHGAAQEGAAR